MDPLVLAVTMNLNEYKEIIAEKILRHSKILERHGIIKYLPNMLMFTPTEELLHRVLSKDTLRHVRAYLYEVALPYMGFALKTRQALTSLTLGSLSILRRKITYPNPYSEIYFKVNDKLLKLHETLKNVKVIKDLGGVVNYTVLAEYRENGVKTVVMKKYRDWKAVKWVPTTLWIAGFVDFTPIPSERLLREVRALLTLSKYGFKVPHIYAVDWVNKVLVREYVEGLPLSDIIKEIKRTYEISYKAGELLAKMHSKNIIFGDSRPSNIVYSNGILVPVDLEQSSTTISAGWDIIEFLSFLSVDLLFKVKAVLKAIESFTEGYLSIRKDKSIFYDAFKAKYVRILLPISPILPLIVSHVKNIIEAR